MAGIVLQRLVTADHRVNNLYLHIFSALIDQVTKSSLAVKHKQQNVWPLSKEADKEAPFESKSSVALCVAPHALHMY